MSDFARPWPDSAYTESSVLEAQRPISTNNVLVTFREDVATSTQGEVLFRVTERQPIRAGFLDLASGMNVPAGDTVLLEDIGIALVAPEVMGLGSAMMMSALNMSDDVIDARPEFYLFATEMPFGDNDYRTWGVEATASVTSRYTGAGIKIAVLDTGFDLGHPDVAGRHVTVKDFTVSGGAGADVRGHGTHCAGTAAGAVKSFGIPRYGVATEALLYIGKVLGDSGMGTEENVLAGIAWAIAEGCEVISMSLGRTIRRGEKPSALYERLGRRALDRGSLIVAAAGNDSARASGFIAPVSEPANSPSILAVGAVDQAMSIAYFSNAAINHDGGLVDLVAPGVNVFSAAPMPRAYRTMGGTSMACPHVAGIAALWAQSDSNLRGLALWQALVDNAIPISGHQRDYGAGLVQAPP